MLIVAFSAVFSVLFAQEFAAVLSDLLPPIQGKIWTDRSQYYVGEQVTIFVSISGSSGGAPGFWIIIYKPDGSQVRMDLGGLKSGTYQVSSSAGPPAGTRKVELWYSLLGADPMPPPRQLASCYFNVIGEMVTVTETHTTTITRTTTQTASRTFWRTLTANPVTVTRTLTDEVAVTVYSPTITITITKRAQMILNPFLWLGLGTVAVLGMTNAPSKSKRIRKLVDVTIKLFPFLKPISRLSWGHVRRVSLGAFLVCLVALSFSTIGSYPAFAETVTLTKTETFTEWRTEWITRTYETTTWSTPTVFVTLDRRSTRTVYMPATVTTTVTTGPFDAANTLLAESFRAAGPDTMIEGMIAKAAAGIGLHGLGATTAAAIFLPALAASYASLSVDKLLEDRGVNPTVRKIASIAVGVGVGVTMTVVLTAGGPVTLAGIVATATISFAASAISIALFGKMTRRKRRTHMADYLVRILRIHRNNPRLCLLYLAYGAVWMFFVAMIGLASKMSLFLGYVVAFGSILPLVFSRTRLLVVLKQRFFGIPTHDLRPLLLRIGVFQSGVLILALVTSHVVVLTILVVPILASLAIVPILILAMIVLFESFVEVSIIMDSCPLSRAIRRSSMFVKSHIYEVLLFCALSTMILSPIMLICQLPSALSLIGSTTYFSLTLPLLFGIPLLMYHGEGKPKQAESKREGARQFLAIFFRLA